MSYWTLSEIVKAVSKKGVDINVVYDIGANKGMWYDKCVKILPKSTYYCFEANTKLKKQTVGNRHWFNVVLSSPDKKEVEFYTHPDSSNSGTGNSYYKEQTKHFKDCVSKTRKTTTIDQMVLDKVLQPPQLIKLDTQGSELGILTGARSVLPTTHIIMIETPIINYNQDAPTFDQYVSFLWGNDFVPVGIDNPIRTNMLLSHLDMLFMHRRIKEMLYPDNGVLDGY